ncbi:MAG TPA: sugar nucleotide-binding protein [Pirellulales bacterium]|nr:sugar nucleotide-binding protein [Pirellulales bacterium]
MFRTARAVDDPPLPLLITGVSGVVGYHAVEYFQSRYPGRVVAIRQHDNWKLTGPSVVPCDAEDRRGLRELFDRYQFAGVLNCAGNCALKASELEPAMAWRINVESVRNLVEIARQRGTRFVHLSVDLVFSGLGSGGHLEDDPTDPVTVYGKTMVAAERLISERLPAACILRISLPMGISFNGHAGAIDWIQSRFKKSKPATLYIDEIRTPTYTDCLSRLCQDVLARDLSGIYHAGAPRPLSLFQVAQVINRVGGYPAHCLVGCPRVDAGPMPPRAGNVTMNSGKLASALGYEPMHAWPYDDRYAPTHATWHHERPADEPGSPELLASILYRNPLWY